MSATPKVRKAVYAASLDPITNGHLSVIDEVVSLYDELIVVVAVDPRKNYVFSPEERADMARAAVAHLPNVRVELCVGRYVVNLAHELGAQVVIRGLRNMGDLDAEEVLATENRHICRAVKTIWIPCLPDLRHVSSSVVRSHVGADPEWEKQVARLAPAAVLAKLKEKHILGKARKHWTALMTALGNPKGSEEVFQDLLKRYGEPHRAYHNLEHIVAMLDDFEAVKSSLKPDIEEFASQLAFAIWFHDAVYDPKASNNEAESAHLADKAANALGLTDRADLNKVRHFDHIVNDLIMLTKHIEVPKFPLGRLMVDLDLAILGKSGYLFNAYEVGIRKEYEWVPWVEFRKKRAEILQRFLDRKSIYSLDVFWTKYQAAAEENLKRSIENLTRNIIVSSTAV